MWLGAIQAVLGIAALVALAWAISENRRGFPWRTAAAGLLLQFALALLLIKLPGSQIVFRWIGNAVDALMRSTEAGTSLVFGYLGGGPCPSRKPTRARPSSSPSASCPWSSSSAPCPPRSTTSASCPGSCADSPTSSPRRST